jgi:hypothetical protein
MKKKISLGLGVIAALILVSSAAYSWNFATHAYIADKIGRFIPLIKANEIYGIMAPDIFNLDFSLMNDDVLRAYTHGIPKDDPTVPASQAFMAVWQKAVGPFQKAAAFGFVAHNDAWGADYVAHWKAIPSLRAFPSPYQDQPPGYIIALAVQLDKILETNGVWAGLGYYGISLTLSDRMMFTHNIVEYAGDILIKRADPLIGKKIYEAALLRTPEFPELLVKTFPPGHSNDIGRAEEVFRQQMIQYGLLLWNYNETTVIDVISGQLAGFAIQYLAFVTHQDPSNFSGLVGPLTGFAHQAMDAGVQICEKARYMDEVNLTALYVSLQLLLHRVIFIGFW